MPEGAPSEAAAVGFRVKSGWAAAVLIAGPPQSPRLLDRRAIDLCDPAIPQSRQPYHADRGTLQTDEAKLRRLREVVLRATRRAVAELIQDYRNAGHAVRAAGLVVGSVIEPARITNPHIRAHAFEGQLFRTALAEALQAGGLASTVLVEREVYRQAAHALGRPEADLKRLVAALGRSSGGPWRADEKTASVAACLALA
jgi:hypothetical protein